LLVSTVRKVRRCPRARIHQWLPYPSHVTLQALLRYRERAGAQTCPSGTTGPFATEGVAALRTSAMARTRVCSRGYVHAVRRRQRRWPSHRKIHAGQWVATCAELRAPSGWTDAAHVRTKPTTTDPRAFTRAATPAPFREHPSSPLSLGRRARRRSSGVTSTWRLETLMQPHPRVTWTEEGLALCQGALS